MTTNIFEQIDKDYVQAYKARETERVTVLRLLKTAVKNRLVELKRPGGVLSDEEMLDIVIKEGKQRQDSIEQFTAAGRTDLADKEQKELDIIKEYMPKPFTPDQLDAVIEEVVTDIGATTSKDMGKVMSALMPRCKGRVDGKVLSTKVRQRLQ